MPIQTFPLTSLRKVRQYIVHGLTLPTAGPQIQTLSSLNENSEDIPEPESLDALGGIFELGGFSEPDALPMSTTNTDGWAISTINPSDVLLKLPGLMLKPRIRLVAFVYRAQEEGNGIVWAVPEEFSTTTHLEHALALATDMNHPPHPVEALSDFMEAIEGDRTPASFVIASLLRRELLEFGALGPYRSWSYHRLIDVVPDALTAHWESDYPSNLVPKVSLLPDGRAAVEFFTCRVKPPVAICRHIDQYLADQYTAKSIQKTLIRLGSKGSA